LNCPDSAYCFYIRFHTCSNPHAHSSASYSVGGTTLIAPRFLSSMLPLVSLMKNPFCRKF
jgi:hypothetical protein